jgi:hypothetical protein
VTIKYKLKFFLEKAYDGSTIQAIIMCFMSQQVRLNVIANGENYSLMWTNVSSPGLYDGCLATQSFHTPLSIGLKSMSPYMIMHITSTVA